MLTTQRMKVGEIVEIIGISAVVSNFNGHLDMRRPPAGWVSLLLTIDENCKRVTSSNEYLALFNHNPNVVLRRFITVEEIWIHYNILNTKL